MRVVGAEPAALAAAAEAGAGLAQPVAAGADAEMRRIAGPVAPGEDLDHAADRLGAVQAGTRATHDLDALDLVDRQVLESDQAGGGRTGAYAVDQHQHMVGFAAA